MCQIAPSACRTRTGEQARGLQCPPRGDSVFQNCYFLQHQISIGMQRSPGVRGLLSNVIRVCDWVDNFPLQTVQRIFHIMFPATKDWEFGTLDDSDCNDDIFKKFYWTDVNGDHPDNDASVVVACQPPWLMSDELMWQFTQLKSVSALNTWSWV